MGDMESLGQKIKSKYNCVYVCVCVQNSQKLKLKMQILMKEIHQRRNAVE